MLGQQPVEQKVTFLQDETSDETGEKGNGNVALRPDETCSMREALCMSTNSIVAWNLTYHYQLVTTTKENSASRQVHMQMWRIPTITSIHLPRENSQEVSSFPARFLNSTAPRSIRLLQFL